MRWEEMGAQGKGKDGRERATVGPHRLLMRRISDDGIFSSAYASSLDMSVAHAPAPRTSLPPAPGRISTLWTRVPSGMSARLIALPGAKGASSPHATVEPTGRSRGARMYASCWSLTYWMSAMNVERFGSYSKRWTTAGSVRVRWKSTKR
jgi:hypothetical protein